MLIGEREKKKKEMEHQYQSAALQRLGFVESPRKRVVSYSDDAEHDAFEPRKKNVKNDELTTLRKLVRSSTQDHDADEETGRKRRLSLTVFRKNKVENMAMHNVALRFKYYSEDGEVITRAGFRKLLTDITGKRAKHAIRKLKTIWNEIDTHHTGSVTFDEFVSFVSFSKMELCEIALEFRVELETADNGKGVKSLFKRIAHPKHLNKLCTKKLQEQIETRLGVFILPGELTTLAQMVGNTFGVFKRFMRSSKGEFRQSQSQDYYVTDIEIEGSSKKRQSLRNDGYEELNNHLRGNLHIWVKKVERPSNRGESEDDSSSSDSESEESEDESSDSEHESKNNSSDEEDDNESHHKDKGGSKTRGKAQRQKCNVLLKKNRKDARFSTITKVDVAQGRRDAALVADGFKCVEMPLNNAIIGKPHYLWYKRAKADGASALSMGNSLSAISDAILDIAITTGNALHLESALWSPPCRGFKRVGYNFGKNRQQSVFLWYRKSDATYSREELMDTVKRRSSSVTSDPLSLENRIREQVRETIARQQQQRGGNSHVNVFDPELIFDKVATNRDYLTKKQFVLLLKKLGLQIPTKDMALVFDRLDVLNKGKVYREDVAEFFELSDKDLDSILVQIQGYLRRSKRKGETLLTLFRSLDRDKDGKLSATEFHRLLENMDIVVAPGEVQRLVDRIDIDGNGFIDIHDFAQFLKSREDARSNSIGARVSRLNSNVRRGAKVLFECAKSKGMLGNSSGKLNSKIDVPYAWDRLVTSKRLDDSQPDILDSIRLREILKARGVRLRREEATSLIQALEPKAEKIGGVSYASFEYWIRNHEFVEQRHGDDDDNDGDDKNDEWMGTNGVQAHGKSPKVSPRLHRNDYQAFINLHSDFNAIAGQNGNDPFAVFDVLFGTEYGGKISNEKFLKKLKQIGIINAFKDKESLLAQFDRDQDGQISFRDVARFTENGFAGHQINDGFTESDSDSEESHGSAVAGFSPKRKGSPTSRYLDKHRRPASSSPPSGEETTDDGNAGSLWWLEQGKKKRKEDDELNDPYLSRLFANDTRKNWIHHFDELEIRQAETLVGKSRTHVGDAVDINLLHAAVEDAVRRNGGPLNLKRKFARYDPDRSGFISKAKFQNILQKVRLNVPKSEHKALAQLLKRNNKRQGSTMVNYVLFCDIVKTSSEMEAKSMSNVQQRIAREFEGVDYMFIFEGFDRRGNGTIHQSDFKHALRLCNVQISPHDWRVLKPILQDTDENSGRLSYRKLREIIETTPTRKRGGQSESQSGMVAHPYDEKNFFLIIRNSIPARATKEEDFDMASLFETHDLDGKGVVPVEIFVKELLERFDGLSEKQVRSVAREYICPSKMGDFGTFVDYLAFVERYYSSSVHAANEDFILNDFARQVRHVTKQYSLSYEQAMKMRDINQCGFISRYDFRRAVRHDLCIDLSEPNLLYLMDICDTQGDRMVDCMYLSNKLALEHVTGQDISNGAFTSENIRRLSEHIEAKMRKEPYFDLKAYFEYHSLGKPFIAKADLPRFIAGLGFYLSHEDIQVLCPAPNLSFNQFEQVVDISEDDWDVIAFKCFKRLQECERNYGLNFGNECGKFKDPEQTKNGIRSSDFVACLEEFGLPLNELEKERILARFMDPDSKLVLYGSFMDFLRSRVRKSSF